MTAVFDKKASDEVIRYLDLFPSKIDGSEKPSEMTVVKSSVKEAR